MIALLIGGLLLIWDASYAFKMVHRSRSEIAQRIAAASIGSLYGGTGIYLLIDVAHHFF